VRKEEEGDGEGGGKRKRGSRGDKREEREKEWGGVGTDGENVTQDWRVDWEGGCKESAKEDGKGNGEGRDRWKVMYSNFHLRVVENPGSRVNVQVRKVMLFIITFLRLLFIFLQI
jgi:hypothetical protein